MVKRNHRHKQTHHAFAVAAAAVADTVREEEGEHQPKWPFGLVLQECLQEGTHCGECCRCRRRCAFLWDAEGCARTNAERGR